MNLKKLNILLADDDTDDCTFFKEALEDLKLSAHLTIVHDGEELMQLLEHEKKSLPDVLFLDINMPRKNGFECLSEIRHDKKLKDLPVVMFSTSNSIDKISAIFKIGAHVYIHKPGDFAQLKEVISHALPIVTEATSSNKKVKYILNA
jgi:CheY-like chemotaxis protein